VRERCIYRERLKRRERERNRKKKKLFCRLKNDVLFEGEEEKGVCEGIDLKKAILDGQVEVK